MILGFQLNLEEIENRKDEEQVKALRNKMNELRLIEEILRREIERAAKNKSSVEERQFINKDFSF